MTTAAVLLAAGAGTRFTGSTHKLFATFKDRPLLHHSLDHVVAAGLDEVIVISGSVDLAAEAARWPITIVENHRWSEGLATSLALATRAAADAGHDAIVVGLADQPDVQPEAWRRVASATNALVAVATYAGVRGHPVRLAAEVWPLLPTTGDVGASSLLRERPDLVIEVPCEGSPADIDTWDDLIGWNH